MSSSYFPGRNPLNYQGTNVKNPPEQYQFARAPTVYDWETFNIGDEWLDTSATPSPIWYKLVSKARQPPPANALARAIWKPTTSQTINNLNSLTGDTGGAITPTPLGTISLLGTSHILSTTGDLPSNSITFSIPFASFNSGSNVLSFLNPNSNVVSITVDNSGNIVVPAGDFLIQRSQAPGGPQCSLYNTSNGTHSNVRFTMQTAGSGDLYTLFALPGGSPFSWECGVKGSDSSFQIQNNPSNAAAGLMDGTSFLTIASSGNITVPVGSFLVSNASGSATSQIAVQNTNGGQFAQFLATANSTKTGYFSSGQGTIAGGQYWNFGMASTLSNAFCINYSAAGSSAPEGGTLLFELSKTGLLTLNSTTGGDGINVVGTASGSINVIEIDNTNNTPGSGSAFLANVAGTSAADPYISWTVGSSASYAFGIDNPTSGQPLKLTYVAGSSSNPSTGLTLLQMSSAGLLTLPVSTLGLAIGSGGPTITSGSGAPGTTQPKGSLYLRTDGSGANNRAYIATDSAGTWTAIVTVG